MYMTMVKRQDKIKRKQRVKLNIIIKKLIYRTSFCLCHIKNNLF
jgi:hypothetical protein